jgi:hypothetical protein
MRILYPRRGSSGEKVRTMETNYGMLAFEDCEPFVRVSAHHHGELVWVDTSLYPFMGESDKEPMAKGNGLWPAEYDFDVLDQTFVGGHA